MEELARNFFILGQALEVLVSQKDLQALYNLSKDNKVELNTVKATIKTNVNQKSLAINKLLHLLKMILKNLRLQFWDCHSSLILMIFENPLPYLLFLS